MKFGHCTDPLHSSNMTRPTTWNSPYLYPYTLGDNLKQGNVTLTGCVLEYFYFGRYQMHSLDYENYLLYEGGWENSLGLMEVKSAESALPKHLLCIMNTQTK